MRRLAEATRLQAEANATAHAVEEARSIYEAQLAVSQQSLEADLQAIRDNHNAQLAKAREDADAQLAAFKSDLRAERGQRQADLEQDRLLGKASKRKQARPSPISTPTVRRSRTESRSSSRAPSPARSDQYTDDGSLATEVVVPKDLVTLPVDVDMEGNSPTPRADIPLAPQPDVAPKNALLEALAQGLKQINDNFAGKFDAIATRLATIEQGSDPYNYDHWNPQWGLGESGADMGFPDENTPEQDAMLAAQRHQAMAADTTLQAALDDHDRLRNEADDARMDDDDRAAEHHRLYGTTDAEIEAAGGDPATIGTHYAAGLIRLGGPPRPPANAARGDRQSQPIELDPTPSPLPPRNAANPAAPTPPAPASAPARPLTYADRAAKATEGWQTVAKKKRPASIPTKSTLAQPAPTTNGPAWSLEKLSERTTTIAMIRAHAVLTYGATLGARLRKPALIAAYQALATTPRPARGPAAAGNNRPRATPNTSEWTVRRLPNTTHIAAPKPCGGDPIKLVRLMQTALCQQTGEATPPLTLLAGRWSVGLTPNFVLTFAGKPAAAVIHNYSAAFLKHFPPIYQLVPNHGYTKLVVHGVPILCHADGTLPTSDELLSELNHNLHLHQWKMLDRPNWVKLALLDPGRTESSFSFALLDTTGSINWALRTPCYMFGKACEITRAQSYVQHRQCERCHMLTHLTAECRRPADYKRCGICGIPGHTQAEHTAKHCRRLHLMLLCDCAPSCFNCTYRKLPAKGHYAFGDNCPLKKNMRRYASEPGPVRPPATRTAPAHLVAPVANAPTQATV